jgi:AraC-like DNA-binding protein
MISLERVLDGLEVSVDPIVLHDLRRERPPDRARPGQVTVRYPATGGGGIVELAGGATVRYAPSRLTILPPRPRARADGEASTHRAWRRNDADERAKGSVGSPERDVMVGTGRMRATYLGAVGLFDQLREPLAEDLRAGDPIGRAFRALFAEIAGKRPGRRAMVEALLRQCLILFLRRNCKREGRIIWMAALEDLGLGRAVAAMRDRPEHSFTLQGLAEVAGMSRSVFAARFIGSLDRSPMEFLKDLRLARAAELLSRTDLPVKIVAARVGYSSRSSFTRAFLANQGIGPSAFRAAGHERPLHGRGAGRGFRRRGLEPGGPSPRP